MWRSFNCFKPQSKLSSSSSFFIYTSKHQANIQIKLNTYTYILNPKYYILLNTSIALYNNVRLKKKYDKVKS